MTKRHLLAAMLGISSVIFAQNTVISFAGVNTSFSTPVPNFMPASNSFSFTAWVKPSGTGNRTLMSWADSLGSTGIALRLETDNKLYFLSNGVGAFTKCVSANSVALNQWTHIGFVVNAGVPSLYINGLLSQTSYVSGSSPFPTPVASVFNNMNFGGLHHGGVRKDPFSGYMDDCAVFAGILDVTEIKSVMLNGPVLSDNRLFGYYDFEDALLPGKDKTGKNNNLRMNSVTFPKENKMEDKTVLSKYPLSKQLYPRNLTTNKAQVTVEGMDIGRIAKNDSVKVFLYKNTTLQKIHSLPLSYVNDTAKFSIPVEINAELSNYSFKTYIKKSLTETLISAADSVVAGDAFIINGQSNAEAQLYSGSASTNAHSFIRVYGSGSDVSPYYTKKWYEANPDGNNLKAGNIGQWGIRLARLILDKEQIPVAFLNGARSGMEISYFQRNDAAPTTITTNYGRLLLRAREAGLSNAFRALFWYQGESDGITKKSNSYYKSQFNALYADWKVDYPSLERFYSFQIKNACSGGTPESSAVIQEAQVQLSKELPNLSIMSTVGGNNASATNCHFEYLNGYKLFGDWMYQLVSRDIYKRPAVKQIDAPRIKSVSLISADTILITTADSLVLETGVESSFQLYNNAVTVKKVLISDVTNLKLALTAPLTKLDSLTMYGCACVDFPIIKNKLGIGMLRFYKQPIKLALTDLKTNTNADSMFRIFPNPTLNKANFRFSLVAGGNVNLSIYQLNGLKVTELIDSFFSNGVHDFTADLTHLQAGIYLCTLRTPGQSITYKLVRGY